MRAVLRLWRGTASSTGLFLLVCTFALRLCCSGSAASARELAFDRSLHNGRGGACVALRFACRVPQRARSWV